MGDFDYGTRDEFDDGKAAMGMGLDSIGRYGQRIERLSAKYPWVREMAEDVGREVAEMESLVGDMYESMFTVSEAWAHDLYHDRMAALGLLEGDGGITRTANEGGWDDKGSDEDTRAWVATFAMILAELIGHGDEVDSCIRMLGEENRREVRDFLVASLAEASE